MIDSIQRLIRSAFNQLGLDIIRYEGEYPNYIEEPFIFMYETIRHLTGVHWLKAYATYKAVEYVSRYRIEGDLVECGVFRGGMAILMGNQMAKLGLTDRRLFLYDTFEGMPEPAEFDIGFDGTRASSVLRLGNNKKKKIGLLCLAPLEQVKANFEMYCKLREGINFIKGKIEETIRKTIPDKISVLRLDTDWYESTKYELVHLFPRLSDGGVLIIDDYGSWKGAKKATDEFFKESSNRIFFSRTADGVIGIKQ